MAILLDKPKVVSETVSAYRVAYIRIDSMNDPERVTAMAIAKAFDDVSTGNPDDPYTQPDESKKRVDSKIAPQITVTIPDLLAAAATDPVLAKWIMDGEKLFEKYAKVQGKL